MSAFYLSEGANLHFCIFVLASALVSTKQQTKRDRTRARERASAGARERLSLALARARSCLNVEQFDRRRLPPVARARERATLLPSRRPSRGRAIVFLARRSGRRRFDSNETAEATAATAVAAAMTVA